MIEFMTVDYAQALLNSQSHTILHDLFQEQELQPTQHNFSRKKHKYAWMIVNNKD